MPKPIYNLLTFVLFFAACSSKTGLVGPDLNSYQVQQADVNLTLQKDAAPADGVSSDILLFKGGPSVTGHYNTITLQIAPNGKFSNDSTTIQVPLNVNGQAQIFASSNTIGYNTVTASVGGASQSATPYFGTAWPVTMTVNPDSTFASTDTFAAFPSGPSSHQMMLKGCDSAKDRKRTAGIRKYTY